MFRFIGRLTSYHPWAFVCGWVVIAVFVGVVAPNWDRNSQDDDIRALPEYCPSVKGYKLLEEAFPGDVFASNLVLAFERLDSPLSEDDFKAIDAIRDGLEKLRHDEPSLAIQAIHAPADPILGRKLKSADGRCALVKVQLQSPYMAVQTRFTVDRIDEVASSELAAQGVSGLKMHPTGPAGIGRDLIKVSTNSLENTTLATVLLVIVILLWVYRAPLLAMVPLVTIAIAVFVALQSLALLTLIPGFKLASASQIFAVVMLYGAGTDYCLFLVSRYREELAEGRPLGFSVESSVNHVGHALAASAGTVICGLGLMGTADFAKVRSGGPAIALSLMVAFLASLTLTPALLKILGSWAFWPGRPPGRPGSRLPGARGETDEEDFWTRLSGKLLKRPGLAWLGAMALLAPLALLGTATRTSFRATAELSGHSPSIVGLDAVQRHFPAGEAGPVTVLLESPVPFDTSHGRRLIEHLSQGFLHLENVREVRALTRPLGQAIPEPARQAQQASAWAAAWQKVVDSIDSQVRRMAGQHYLSTIPPKDGAPARHVTRLEVVLETDPFDPRSAATLGSIQTWISSELPNDSRAFGPVRGETFGITVAAFDLASVTETDRARINLLVTAAVFVILFLFVRDLVLAAYLLLTVLFSYMVTLGATMLIAWIGFARPFGEVDWRVPFFLFVILVAVGEDYNILLISRMLQERRRHGPAQAMRLAVARTGSTITSCGLIMAGTFATLMLAGLNTLVQIGFALAFGVLLDTLIIRPILVPALCIWFWERRDRQREQAKENGLPLRKAG
jgi:RND superfamily putative drug exporter